MEFRVPLSNLAPMLIHTYTRLDHLKKTIEALLKNELASATDLIIASDYSKNEEDLHAVLLVREYIDSIKGFKSITKILRKRNFGPYENPMSAIDEIFKRYDRVILMEDDTIVGVGFIKFINEGLMLYKDDKSVFAICGYLWRGIAVEPRTETVLLPAFSAWGYGIWKDRYYQVPDHQALAAEFLKKPIMFFKFNMNRPDLLGGVKKLSMGASVPDLANLLHMIKTRKVCLFPTKSLVRNIGHDGSGVNCQVDHDFANQPYNEKTLIEIITNMPVAYDHSNTIFYAFGGWKILILNFIKHYSRSLLGDRVYKKIVDFKK